MSKVLMAGSWSDAPEAMSTPNLTLSTRPGAHMADKALTLRIEMRDVGRSGLSVAAFANSVLDETYGIDGLISEVKLPGQFYGEPRMSVSKWDSSLTISIPHD